ncbi:MAG: hypothetical protein HYU77_14620 [Betaproteobacteria bacterium]|nr:hypothetical protein [Betaproteobacteria bacterium]
MIPRTRTVLLSALAAALALSGGALMAEPTGPAYLTDSRGKPVKNSFNQCWRTAYGTSALPSQECDAELPPRPALPAFVDYEARAKASRAREEMAARRIIEAEVAEKAAAEARYGAEAAAAGAPPPAPPAPPPSPSKKAAKKNGKPAAAGEIRAFPWPPPQASAFAVIPTSMLSAKAEPKLKDVAQRLERAFDAGGYAERSYYSIPGGFAVVSRIELIRADGAPEAAGRWSLRSPVLTRFSLTEYLKALFSAKVGRYRIIAFLATDASLQPDPSKKPTSEGAADWVSQGSPTLPAAIGNLPFTQEHNVTALIYEFERRTPDHEAELKQPSPLPGKGHLEKAGIWTALGG